MRFPLQFSGGFKHGSYLAFDANDNSPLCNVYLPMPPSLGLEINAFGSSTGTIRGLNEVLKCAVRVGVGTL